MPLLLTRKDVETVLTMKDAIAAVEEGFRQLALGNVIMPQRTVIRIPDYHGLHLAMPGYVGGAEEGGALAVKVVTVYPDNPSQYGLPTTLGTLVLNDPRTGALVAIMDAGFLTAMRTGAAAGVATKYLAREDARSVGIFGAGVQARTQLEAVCTAREVRSVRVYDLVVENLEAFVADMAGFGAIPDDVQAVASPAEAVKGASIIACATTSRTPVFDGDDLEPGAHVNAVGAYTPEMREIDGKVVTRAKIVVDHREAAWEEAGDLIIARDEGLIGEDDIHAELGEVVNGDRPGRESEEEITFFKSVGVAVQDAAIAPVILKAAEAKGIGTLAEL